MKTSLFNRLIAQASALFLVLIFPLISNAQNPSLIKGKVVDNQTGEPLQYATVALIDSSSQQLLNGITTSEDGSFMLTTESNGFLIEISFIGYKTKRIREYQIDNKQINLGVISLNINQNILDELVVTGEKSQTVFKLDKRVFNVGTDLSKTGASALEVLNNVPSVTVNIEGQISLRGSQGVQVLINGKPSVIADPESNALGTISADMIEKVEVITNPSSKYDAEGTSGIINIVLKKEEKKGFNGSITLNAGEPTNQSFGLSLNRRTEKFNLFTQLGAGKRTFPRYQKTENEDLINQSIVESDGEAFKTENFYNITLGSDYHINKNNTISLSGNFAYEFEDETSEYDFNLFEKNNLTQSWKRDENTEATNPKWQFDLQYAKDFKSHKDHDLIISAVGSFFGKDKTSNFGDQIVFGNQNNITQESTTDFDRANYIFKLDYTYPFSKGFKLETGGQYAVENLTNNFEVKDNQGNGFIVNPNLSNEFDFSQNILGIYSTLSYELNKWGIMLGARVENTELSTELKTTNQKNEKNYTNLFHSIHTSYEYSKKLSFQGGYSKRIYRPRSWDLNPFFSIRNNYNIRTGNPNLLPEYTDVYELTSIFQLKKASFNIGVFHRFTRDVVENLTTFSENQSIQAPDNIGTNALTGLEFNAKYRLNEKINFRGDFNWNTFQRRGDYEGVSFDFNGTKWTSRISSKIKLPLEFEFEISGNYNSKYKTVQGITKKNLFANLGLRKKFLKGKLVTNLSIRDLFASRVQETQMIQTDFLTYNHMQSGRFTTIGLSYSLGKGEAMEYSARKRF